MRLESDASGAGGRPGDLLAVDQTGFDAGPAQGLLGGRLAGDVIGGLVGQS